MSDAMMVEDAKGSTGSRHVGRPIASERDRFVVLSSRFNEHVVERLVRGAVDALVRHGARPEHVEHVEVTGAWEMPLVAARLAASGRYAGIVAVGAVIRGETPHFDYVAGAAAQGLARVSLDHGTPVGFGLLTVDETSQAVERSGGKAGNKGAEAALAMLETVDLLRRLDEGDEGTTQGA